MTMNTITVYEHSDFRGLYKTFTSDVPNLVYENFNDCISSVKIAGQPWVLYQDLHYQGQCLPLEEGEYSGISMNDGATSLRLITDDLSNPQITVYENSNSGGKSLVLTQESNLSFGGMQDNISSHSVQRGAWALYEHINKGGRCIVARAGEYLANYRDIGFNDQVSYVYPLRAGKSSVTATILWDRKTVESERNFEIDQYHYKNQSNVEQQFTATSSKEFEKFVSHSFEFSNETTIKVGTSFTLKGVVDINTELSNTFTVKKGETQSSTMRKKTELSMPVKAPPRSNVTVSFLCKEVTISVPVELKIVQGGNTRIETGTYRCQSGTETTIDVQCLPIG
uniref:Ep37-A1 n=1 Tax=Cynops pyrrhogaster TaxID=8330 RepID=O42343_CYNPY|nr:ep37-A1 [Cynops pyrrhogaster]